MVGGNSPVAVDAGSDVGLYAIISELAGVDVSGSAIDHGCLNYVVGLDVEYVETVRKSTALKGTMSP